MSLGWGPLLQRLRRGSRPLVRRLHRSYGPIRLLRIVHHRLRFTSLPDAVPAYDSSGQRAALPGPGDRRVRVHGFFDTAGPGHGSPVAPQPVLPSTKWRASTLQIVLSMLNSSARIPRYRRFAGHLAMTRARLAERRGVAYSFAAEDLHLLPTHQFAWRSQMELSFPVGSGR